MLKELKNFAVYLSDYLLLLLFFVTTFFIMLFLIFDTTYLSQLGIFDNKLIHMLISFFASVEICGLFFSYYYFKLKKLMHFSRVDRKQINLNLIIRFIYLKLIVCFIRIVAFVVFFSPSALFLSALVYSVEKGVSERVFILFAVCSVFIFFISIFTFSVYSQKLCFLKFAFIRSPYLSFKSQFSFASEISDGNMLSLLVLRLSNIPKKILSLLILPAIYFLPDCLYDVYDFIKAKENPYPHKVNTEKTVVFYFEPIKGK